MDFALLGNIITALTPVLVPSIVALLKRLTERLPKPVIPYLAILLGAGIEILNTAMIGNNQGSIFRSATIGGALGAAGIGMREVLDQTRKGLRH